MEGGSSHNGASKLSFSLGGATTSNARTSSLSQDRTVAFHNEDDVRTESAREDVVSIGASGLRAANDAARKPSGPLVIPALPNAWKIGSGRPRAVSTKNSDNTTSAPRGDSTKDTTARSADEGALASEAARALLADADAFASGGEPTGAVLGVDASKVRAIGEKAEQTEDEITEQRRREFEEHRARVAQGQDNEAFRSDLAALPDAASDDAYDSVPVEEFGIGLLRGMGWAPGQAIGNRAKGPAQPYEFIPRHDRLGLGAAPKAADPDLPGRIKRPGDDGRRREYYELAPSADGRKRHVRTLDQEVRKVKTSLEPGDRVRILRGRHSDLEAEIVAVRGEELVLRLATSGVDVVEPRRRVAWIDPAAPQAEPAAPSSRPSKRHRTRDGNSAATSAPASQTTARWALPNIRVRIVSRSFCDGKYYNKKAAILDVVGDGTCTVVTEDTKQVIERVRERHIETVVSRHAEGTDVIVLRGDHRGERGRLLQRDAKRNAAAVQLEDLQVLNLTLDDVAEAVSGQE